MLKRIFPFLLVVTFIGSVVQAQAQTCSGGLTISLTGSASGTALAAPTGNSTQTLCTGSRVSDLVATPITGATINWYSAATGGTALSSTTILTSTTYYASQILTTTSCESALRLAVTVSISPASTLSLSSASNTDAQTVCQNIAITSVTYTVSNATSATVSGLPTGVTGTYASGILTLSGTPSVSGAFTYTVTTTGGCSTAATATGTLTINPAVAAGTCTVANDACQLNAGQIKIEVSGGTPAYTLTATKKAVAPNPAANGTFTTLTTTPTVTTASGITSYLFSGLAGNVEYKFLVTDSKGCFVGGTH
jgi:hypothetical protein